MSHFSIGELTFSKTATARGIDNTPNEQQSANLELLRVTCLEPIREALACPIIITVGFRSAELNAAVGGVATSEHLEGLAADFYPQQGTLLDAFNQLRTNPDIVYDQLILETGCIHVGLERPNTLRRHEALIRHGDPGSWSYERLA